MFELSEEHRMLKDLVAKFVDRDLIPLEKAALARETRGEASGLTEEEEAKVLATCKELGLWGLDVPEQYGGAALPYSASAPPPAQNEATVNKAAKSWWTSTRIRGGSRPTGNAAVCSRRPQC